MVLLGAGCIPDSQTNTNDNTGSVTDETNDDTGGDELAACETGLTRYISSRHNLTFCYPEDAGDNRAVTVKEESDGVVFSVAGKETRKIAVVTIDESADREAEVRKYFDTPTTNGVTCDVIPAERETGGDREAYIIVGESNGSQTNAAVSECAESGKLQDLLNDHGQGEFIFYKDVSVMYVLSLEQDASLGQLSEEFVDSIEPKTRE